MDASLGDILTTQKNGVVAINAYTTTLSTQAGANNTKELSTSTVIKSSSGWLATVSVIVGGSTTGYLYDTNSTSATAGNRIYTVPNTPGVYKIMMPFSTGLTFVPGTGSIIAVGYT